MSEDQKVPDRNHALNVLAADLSELYGWLKLSTRYAAAHEALAVVERELGLPVGEDLFPRRGPQLAPQPPPTAGGDDPATDPVGTVRVFPRWQDEYHERQYAIRWVKPLDRDELYPWLLLDSEGPQRLDDDAVRGCKRIGVSQAVAELNAVELLAPQPPPSVAAGAELAEVLAGLLTAAWERLDTRQAQFFATGYAGDLALGMREIVGLIEAEQKPATGARAVGETELWDAICADDGFRSAVRMTDPEYGVDSSIVNQIASEVVRVVDAFYAAAPPTPSAHGVAELLAEARRLIKEWPGTVMPCAEIVRLLTPGGADGGEG